MGEVKRRLIVSSRNYNGNFDDGNYVWLVGDKWLTVQRKDGKWRMSIPREAIDYVIEAEGER